MYGGNFWLGITSQTLHFFLGSSTKFFQYILIKLHTKFSAIVKQITFFAVKLMDLYENRFTPFFILGLEKVVAQPDRTSLTSNVDYTL